VVPGSIAGMRLIPRLDPQLIDWLVEFGSGIRRLRVGLGLSQAALAERCGCSQSSISRVEHGLVPNMQLRRTVVLLNVLHAMPGSPPRQPEPTGLELSLASTLASGGNAEDFLRRLIG
jgi:transcriptional regulator with XRE-family HTH domain